MKVEWTVSGPPSAQDTFVGRHIFKERKPCPLLPGRELAPGHSEFGEGLGQRTSVRAQTTVSAPKGWALPTLLLTFRRAGQRSGSPRTGQSKEAPFSAQI